MTRIEVVYDQVTNHQLPAWARVWLWALANANEHGHARAWPGELRRVLHANASDVSRAIRLARERDLLDPTSSAYCLVLPGRAIAPCEATHREAS
ncbi:hypothetical protein NPS01_42670 [Nocardioides psychrotolerans]|uniref:Uncharacterized protein n=1 Tax=Nocardioides psychrotolerans TaxID=1005945 RepID=A0A1I3MBI0_9ACTN|nr:hypothetical protein [Nocardioides psychrotolerans]GEP40604.1 hypothetical protein NPS01_42670 [Nocardioides psychrotolerans]SFI94328.1 hypothetical protein SAMN05216561_11538 [Nocardioides psychrotolerans]